MNKINKNNIHYLLKTTLELANEAIYLISKEGKILFANSTACKNLGYSRREVINLYVWDVDALVTSKEAFVNKLEHFSSDENNSNTMQTRHIRKDKSTFPVEINSRLVSINGSEHLISYVNDISHRLKQDEQIKLYFEFIKESSDMIFLVDLETKYIEFANEKVCKTLGYSQKEIVDTKISDIRKAILNSKEIDEVFEELQDEKNMTTYGEYLCKDGSSVSVETTLSLKSFRDKNYVMAISRDITERLQIEKEKEEIQEKLKNYNKTLKKEVSKIKKELLEYEDIMHRQSKMAAMGEMLENIAHQWRQPLSVISVLSTGMKIQNDTNTLDQETLTNGLNDINTSSQYLSKTIDDFRDFFKPNYKKTKFHIKEIIDYTINLSKTKFKSHDIKIIENIMDLEVYTFKNELIQVLINLLNNAGDELVKKENQLRKIIFVETYEDEDFIFIKILDNAGGISPDIMNRIFEPYFTTKHKAQGTGIGLYMSDEIVRKHMRGSIIVKNKEFMYEDSLYKGAKFIVKLPKN